jgi:phosphonate transport system substrate-binding protein
LAGLALALLVVAGCNRGGTTAPVEAPATERALTKLKVGVLPSFPIQADNPRQLKPFADELGKAADLPVELIPADDRGGPAEALRGLDVAWLRPWGYVQAHHGDPSIQAIATVKYKDKPTDHAVLVARADAPYNTLDEAIKQSRNRPLLKLSLADAGSTTGWLIPLAELKRRGVNLQDDFYPHKGAALAAQAAAVITGQADIASDSERNLDALAGAGKIDRTRIKIIWTSEPLPNDAVVVRGGFPDDLKAKLQKVLVDMTPEQARAMLPKGCTGFVASDGSSYAPIEAAAKQVGKLK